MSLYNLTKKELVAKLTSKEAELIRLQDVYTELQKSYNKAMDTLEKKKSTIKEEKENAWTPSETNVHFFLAGIRSAADMFDREFGKE